jgi:hypothetical protein
LLVSANAFSAWSERNGYRQWRGWNLSTLSNLPSGADCVLDSGGFTAHSAYRGFPWTVDQYLALATAYPFRLFAALDYPVERELAPSAPSISERLSRTICANYATFRAAKYHQASARMMPVLQGRTATDYAYCASKLAPIIDTSGTIGLGSMCRRHTHGDDGILSIVATLDQLIPSSISFHLFGAKGDALRHLTSITTRNISIDSQAYGIAARRAAYQNAISKTDAFVASHMTNWLMRQRKYLRRAAPMPGAVAVTPTVHDTGTPRSWPEALLAARRRLNDLIEDGDLDHDQITENWVAILAAELLHPATSCDGMKVEKEG